MADLITTIKVNSNQFDNSIKESTNQIRKFEAEAKKSGGSVNDFGSKLGGVALGGIAKFAGALGVAFTSMEALQKVVSSTNTTADAFERITYQASTAVDYFFQSIATGDWSNFFDGLTNATARAREFKEILNELDDKKEARQWFMPEEKLKFERNRNVINNTKSTKEERQAAITENEELIKSWTDRAQREVDLASEAINKRVETIVSRYNGKNLFLTGENRISAFENLDGEGEMSTNMLTELIFRFKEDPYKLTLNDVNVGEYLEKKRRLDEERKEAYEKAISGDKNEGDNFIENNRTKTYWRDEAQRRDKAYNDFINNSSLETQFIEDLIELENLFNEKNTAALIAQKDQGIEQLINIETFKRTNFKLENRVNGGKKDKEDEIFPEGSIADIDKQISDLNKQLSLEIDPEKRKLIYDEIEWLKRQKIIIEIEYKEGIKPNDPNYKNIGESYTDEKGNKKWRDPVKDKDFSVKPSIDIKGDLAGMNDWFTSYQDWFTSYQDNLKKMEEESISSANIIGLAFSSIGNIFGTLGSVTDDTTSRMLGGFQTILGGIGTMIPAIESMTAAQQAGAIAGATKSGAEMPFPLNLVAITSGVAAVLAGFAQMRKVPKFAEGGLVYGNTIAQVGEYSGASSNPEVIAPLSKLRNILEDTGSSGGGTVDFRIKGSDLEGALRNYNSKKRKK